MDYDAVACRCDQPLPDVCIADILPTSLSAGRMRACELILDAGSEPTFDARRLLMRAAKIAKRLQRKAIRAGQHGVLSPDCSTALAESFAELWELTRDYARSLPRR